MEKIPPMPPMPPLPNRPAPMPGKPAPARRPRRSWTLTMAGGTALILAALVIVRYASAPPDDVAADDRLERSEEVAANAPATEPVSAAPAPETLPVASAGFAAPVVEEQPAAPIVKAQPKKVVMPPAKTRVAASARTSAKSTAKETAPISVKTIDKAPVKGDAATSVRASAASAAIVGPPPVTLTGCLEMSVDREEFRLTDTDGVYAPKSRSWKTGFLKKRPTPVALVESPDPHGLQTQVGKRVEATGRLIDHDMKVSSVRVVAPSCD